MKIGRRETADAGRRRCGNWPKPDRVSDGLIGPHYGRRQNPTSSAENINIAERLAIARDAVSTRKRGS